MAERGGTAVNSRPPGHDTAGCSAYCSFWSVSWPLGRDPALLLRQGGCPMFSVDLSTRECDGHVVVVLRGELDLADAADVADVAAAVAAAVAREPGVIVDLAGLEFIDCGGVAALARGRRHARRAGGTCCSPRRGSGCCGFLRSPGWPASSPSMPAWKRRPAAPDAPGGRPCRGRGGSARYAGRAPPGGQERQPWGAEHGNPRQRAGGAAARSPSAAARKGRCRSWVARVSGRLPAGRPGRIQRPDPLRWLRG
jgi:anti-anti-sigma factor